MLADCLCKIARLAYRSGDFESAQHHFSEAAEYIETHIGSSHPLASEAFLGLGILLYQRGMYDGAEKSTRKAMSIRQIALGSSHPSFAEAVEALANICEATGRQFEYEQLTKRAANILSLYAQQEKQMAAPDFRIIQPDSKHSAPFHSILKTSD
jgi:tetratricopeptide (TPR) repeat protein